MNSDWVTEETQYTTQWVPSQSTHYRCIHIYADEIVSPYGSESEITGVGVTDGIAFH